jgi:hypothetical protein
MNSLMRLMVPGRRSLKSMAVMGAASWAMGRLANRSPAARRGVRMMNTATWALPLGMMAVNKVRARRAAEHAYGD